MFNIFKRRKLEKLNLKEHIDNRLNQIIEKAITQEKWQHRLFSFELTAKEIEVYYYLLDYFKNNVKNEVVNTRNEMENLKEIMKMASQILESTT